MRPEYREKYILEICDWLKTTRETLVYTFSDKELDKLAKLWDDGELIRIHDYGYRLIKSGYERKVQ